jgi:hypothetical protein
MCFWGAILAGNIQRSKILNLGMSAGILLAWRSFADKEGFKV